MLLFIYFKGRIMICKIRFVDTDENRGKLCLVFKDIILIRVKISLLFCACSDSALLWILLSNCFRLRTDHRQKKGEKLKMIHGVVYRSTQRILVKANHSGAGSSNLAKHRQLTKSKFFTGFLFFLKKLFKHNWLVFNKDMFEWSLDSWNGNKNFRSFLPSRKQKENGYYSSKLII